MGNNLNKLNDAIFYNLYDQVNQMLDTNPELIDQYFDNQKLSFPLIKAVSLKREKIVSLLLKKENIQVNQQSSTGETSVTRAAKFGLLNMIKLLDDYGCDFTIEDNKERNALDYAILYGKYNCAQYIYKKNIDMKSDSFYEKLKNNFGKLEVNFERFREMLQSGVEIDPSKEKELIMTNKEIVEMVFDPNETYTEMFRSLINFSQPKMIPRDQIKDPKLLPENRSLRGLRQVFNWRGTNYLETTKKVKSAEDQPNQEKKEFVELEDILADSYQVNDIENKNLKNEEIKEVKETKI
jgi:hypothetical protein